MIILKLRNVFVYKMLRIFIYLYILSTENDTMVEANFGFNLSNDFDVLR